MEVVHSFRLRDPWKTTRVDGRVCWERAFHKPTGLEPDEQLWLVISGLPDDAAVEVNDVAFPRLQGEQHGRFHVTSVVGETNRVVINLAASPDDASASDAFPFDVRLAIVEP